MKNIAFNSIMIEGFGSFIKPTKFTLDRKGVNIITGPNGAGKSTIFNALFWCIYKENLKGLTLAKLPTKEKYRDNDWRGTRVAVGLIVESNSYIISRHISFKGKTKGLVGESKLMIFKNGKLVSEELHKDDMQNYIVNLIGLDSKTFLNSILFGQRMKKFIESKPDEKRKVFESVFDIDFIDVAKAKAKVKKDSLDKEISDINTEIVNLDEKIDTLNDKLYSDKKILEEFEKQKADRLESKLKTIESTKDKLKASESNLRAAQKDLKELQLGKLNLLKKEYEKFEISHDNFVDKIRHERRKISGYDNDITGYTEDLKRKEKSLDNVKTVCPTCNGPLKPKDISNAKKSIKDSISVIETTIQTLTKSKESSEELIESYIKSKDEDSKELEILDQQIKAFDDLVSKKSKLSTTIATNNANISTYKDSLEELEKEYEQEKSKKIPEIDLKATEDKINSLADDAELLEEKVSKKEKELARVNWWIKTGFASGGLKSYIYNSMLSLLNKSIEKYSSRLGFKMIFSIDMEKKSKPFLTKCYGAQGVEFDYDEFSGGEKARVDVSAAFAMHDLVSSSTNINILIMDEIFEGLDGSGIEDVGDLIKLKANGKSVYVITHLNNVDFGNCKRLEFEKINNSTKIS